MTHPEARIPIDIPFILAHIHEDPMSLRLKYMSRNFADQAEKERCEASILQIECRQRYARKFPGLLTAVPSFIFPSRLAGEQASHLWISRLHAMTAARIVAESTHRHPNILVDLTAGLGIDFINLSSALSHDGDGCMALELDATKASVLAQNLDSAGLAKAIVRNCDSMEWIGDPASGSATLIFADPARRDSDDSRLYDPRQCMPDIAGIWNKLLEKADTVMIKNSPMLDVNMATKIYPGTVRIIVASVRNECKEVLIVARKGGRPEGIECVNILGATDAVGGSDCQIQAETLFIPADKATARLADVRIAEPEDLTAVGRGEDIYLYEPNASIMKVMPWSYISGRYGGMRKLSPNCHIFISPVFYPEFPGRRLRITARIDKTARKQLKGAKYNVVTRNYPVAAQSLATSLKVKSGGEAFLYGVTVGRDESPALLLATPA